MANMLKGGGLGGSTGDVTTSNIATTDVEMRPIMGDVDDKDGLDGKEDVFAENGINGHVSLLFITFRKST